MRICYLIIFLSFSLNLKSQDLYEDSIIKSIRSSYARINDRTKKIIPVIYKFSYCGRYINEAGDTLFEGECEEREFSLFKFGDRIVRVNDKSYGGEGGIHSTSIEYNFVNDSLIFVFISSNHNFGYTDNLKGNEINLEEERIYFNKLIPYFHVKRTFHGSENNRNDFYKLKQDKVSVESDNYYIQSANEIIANYLNNQMSKYEEEIERFNKNRSQNKVFRP